MLKVGGQRFVCLFSDFDHKVLFHKCLYTIQQGVEVFLPAHPLHRGVRFKDVLETRLTGHVHSCLISIFSLLILLPLPDELQKILQRRARTCRQVNLGSCLPKRHTCLVGKLQHAVDGTLSNAAPRVIDYPLQCLFILWIDEQSQVGNHIFHLFPLIKRHAPKDAIGNVVAAEVFFKTAALRIGAVQDGNVAIAKVVAVFVLNDGVRHAIGLLVVCHGPDKADAMTIALVTPYFFLYLSAIERDYFIGSPHDVRSRTIILFQFEYLYTKFFEILLKIQNVLYRCPPEAID